MKKKINSVKCLECGEILTSTFGYDFQMCKCSNSTFCDGGPTYPRIGGISFEKIAVFDNDLGKYVSMNDRLKG